jgi:hypothetical protein
MQLIETKTVGTAVNTLEFTSIPQTFTDLYILLSVRTTIADNIGYTTLRVNNVTTNWNVRFLQGNTSAVTTGATTAVPDFFGSGGNTTANTFGNGSVYIPNYASSSITKSLSIDFISENNASSAFSALQRNVGAVQNTTTAITSFQIIADGVTNLAVGTTVSVYGILKGSDGIVTVS